MPRLLAWLLRIFGFTAVLALPAVFFPVSWMGAIHAWAGLGTFPEAPIVDYLARSLSLFYALIGGLMLLVATDVVRYRTVILYVGWASAAGGALLLGIDLHAGMPTEWTIHEGPMGAAFGLLVAWLGHRLPAGPDVLPDGGR